MDPFYTVRLDFFVEGVCYPCVLDKQYEDIHTARQVFEKLRNVTSSNLRIGNLIENQRGRCILDSFAQREEE